MRFFNRFLLRLLFNTELVSTELVRTALVCIALAASSGLYAEEKARPDDRAPVGVIDDHTEQQGELIFSYRILSAAMEDNLDGSKHLAASQVLAGGANTGEYMVAPLEMKVDTHLLSLMYGLNDSITMGFSVPYLKIEMLHAIGSMHPTHANETFSLQTEGLGDLKLTSIVTVEKSETRTRLFNLGVSFPSGSIDKKDDMPVLPTLGRTQLPLPMQLGSGTLDFSPGFTYHKILESRSWGSQFSALIRLNENENGYALGDRVQASIWHSWTMNKELSLSTRLTHEQWANATDDDNKLELPKTMTMGAIEVLTLPTMDPENQGGQKTDIALGANTVFGSADTHRIALELNIPVYESLHGPQIDRDLSFTLGYQISLMPKSSIPSSKPDHAQ